MAEFLVNTFAASWKGAFFFPDTATRDGGFDDVLKKIVSSNRTRVEQLGLISPPIVITGTIGPRFADGKVRVSYEVVKKAWLEAIESPGPGVLVHPTEGSTPNLKLRTYSIVETFSGLGSAAISMTFTRSDDDAGISIRIGGPAQVVSNTEVVLEASQDIVAEDFVVTLANVGNFEAAVDQLTGPSGLSVAFDDAVDLSANRFEESGTLLDQAAALVDEAVNQLQIYQTAISEFTNNITKLVQKPRELATAINNIFLTINGIAPSIEGTYSAFKSLFDFGDGIIPSILVTVGRIEREVNRNSVDQMVQSDALAKAYEAASIIQFRTVDEIDEQAKILEDQYSKLRDRDNMDRDTILALDALRVTVSELFEENRLIAQRVQTINVAPGTPAQIAYRYYGNIDNLQLIIDLNELRDGDIISGDLRMLTE